jgi:glycerophosphoryl diester phosphodiesterase
MPRPFYIIGHNPNCVADAIDYLRRGANAIEPDVHFEKDSGRFRVCHDAPSDSDPFLEHYLDELVAELQRDSLNGRQIKLDLIAFDLKPDYDYDLRKLYAIIRSRFSERYPNVLIATTISDPDKVDFLAVMDGDQRPNELLGIDENAQPKDVLESMKDTSLNITFAAGIDVFDFAPLNALIGPRSFLDRIKRATELRELNDRLKLVYAWTVNNESDIDSFLSLEPPIDGLLTDEPERVRTILQRQYASKFSISASV